jgi:branched-chain amino acid transport system substrate-binding protein
MSKFGKTEMTRRDFVKTASTALAVTAVSGIVPTFAIGGTAKVKVGVLLPFTGTYAQLGSHILDAMKLRIAQNGDKLGGREVEYIVVDSEMDVSKSTQHTNKLIKKEAVDFLVGPVHSGIGMNMARLVKGKKVIMIVPNAGANQITGEFCASNIFRTSFTSWQTAFPAGDAMLKAGHKKVALMYFNYAFGKQTAAAFKESFIPGGGEIVADMPTPFPKGEFQSYFTKVAALKPDAVFTFYSGGVAIKFMKDYAAAGFQGKIPLWGTFLTEGTSHKAGSASEGIMSTLHYSSELENATNKKFKKDFKGATGDEADVFAIQGFDTGSLMIQGMDAVKGDTGASEALKKAMNSATIDSPRGMFSFSKANHPIQDIYLREVKGGLNKVVGVAAKALEDPAIGCKA